MLAQTQAQGSHIRMFGHLLLNQPPIFHICHGPHILPPPSAFFFFLLFFSFTGWSFLPIFGVSAVFYIVLPFPWILSFHQWLAFLLNWTRSIYDQTKIQSLCLSERESSEGNRTCVLLRWPSLAHTSYFQLVIIATAMAPLCCFFSSRACTWLRILQLLLAMVCRSLNMCIPRKNVSLTAVSIADSGYFLNESMAAYSPKYSGSLFDAAFIGSPPRIPACSQCSSFLRRLRQ